MKVMEYTPSDCKILIRYTYRASAADDYKSFDKEFDSFADFTNYLIWEPERAEHVGFGTLPGKPVKDKCNSNVSLAVKYTEGPDRKEEVFCKNMDKMLEFFRERPDVAAKLGYRE
jgi:hypothetical protein